MNTKRLMPLFTLSLLLTGQVLLTSSCKDDDKDSNPSPPAPPKDEFTDSRDGKTYKTVTIGKQVWLAENLDYNTNTATDTSHYCYDDNADHCGTYGGLYTWAGAKAAVPPGWHLPSKAEYDTLIARFGGVDSAGLKLQKGGESGFEALLGGVRYNDTANPYNEREGAGVFWTSTEEGGGYAKNIGMTKEKKRTFSFPEPKSYAYSVRCVKD